VKAGRETQARRILANAEILPIAPCEEILAHLLFRRTYSIAGYAAIGENYSIFQTALSSSG